jgi:hypothetical protein
MTVLLDTYDPDWEARWNAIDDELEKEDAKPYEARSQRQAESLLNQLHEAFHARFRTTGEYAEWTENNVRKQAKREGIPDFKVPPFPRDGSGPSKVRS